MRRRSAANNVQNGGLNSEAMLTRALSLTAVGAIGGTASAIFVGERKRSARLTSSPPEFANGRRYRVFHQLSDLGWVNLNLGSFFIWQILLGHMGFRQNWQSNCAGWWNIPNLSQHNQNLQADGTPCSAFN